MRYYGLRNSINVLTFKLSNRDKERYECPICDYRGPFLDKITHNAIRKHAKCPNCSALERHRLQFLVLGTILRDKKTDHLKMLHVAPERFFREFFSQRFGQYETADLKMKGTDHIVDLQHLPFDNNTYDIVYASHVLEHIPDDRKAISEIRRILRPNGMAVLPVPIYSGKTVEFSEPDPNEFGHVRAPGLDYFERYERYFSKVERFDSSSQPEKYQVFVYQENNRPLKTERLSLSSTPCRKLSDVVPVCYA
jgi:SAM-dependent methyltransferase